MIESVTTPITLRINVTTEMLKPGGMTRYTVLGKPSQRPCNTETKR
jgi:hypothetical protein